METESVAQKQARLAREKQARGGKLPPWKKAAFDQTNTELNGDTAQAILKLVEVALATEGCPTSELEEIRTKARTSVRKFNEAQKAPRATQKEKELANRLRSEANDLYLTACSLINKLDNSQGFDLWDRDTWKKSDTID